MPSIRRSVFHSAVLAMWLLVPSLRAADDYQPGPDSLPQDGAPKGDVTKYTFDESRIFPGTTRDYWVYVPHQYDPAKPACLYVGQDGVQFKAPTVFDNLIARGEMPVTIGVFIMHGRVKSNSTQALDRFNRSYEYDGLGDNYARFLLEEILPEVEKKTAPDGRPLHFSHDPNNRAIGGSSSGAICAFTAAWERPDAFRRVFSSIGTYVDQRGGNDYPALIRKFEAKPLRVFLQDGSNDLNKVGGAWFLANQEMLSALEFSGYEVNHIWGEGGHNGKHATAIFPDAMRWLWKDWPKPIASGVNSGQPVAQTLVPGEAWQNVGEGHAAAGGLAANPQGEILFADAKENGIEKIGADGNVTNVKHTKDEAAGLAFAEDGRFYAAAGRVIAVDPSGHDAIIAPPSCHARELCVGYNGNIYFTAPADQQVWLISGGKRAIVDKGVAFSGVCLAPDQSLLLASSRESQFVYSFHINPDGTLADRQPYHHLRIPDGAMASGAAGLAVDTTGNLYVATDLGIQICDQAGRVQGIISAPLGVTLSSLAFGGAHFDDLYAAGGGRIFRRKLNVSGAPSFRPPHKPAAPGL